MLHLDEGFIYPGFVEGVAMRSWDRDRATLSVCFIAQTRLWHNERMAKKNKENT
jgi:hypothetical protein